MKDYDLIVIGSGGGTKIAGPAAEMGLRVALIEEDALGGTCLNRGCIPSKMLIYPADLVHDFDRADALNVRMKTRPELQFADLVQRVTATVDGISAALGGHYRALEGVDLYRTRARFLEDKILDLGGEQITADRIFIAVGSRPSIPDIPGLADTPYLTSKEALRETKLPRSMAILGGGFIACELGHVYATAGSDVHFLVRSKLLRQEDRDIQRTFSEVFGARHNVHEGVMPTEVAHVDGRFQLTLQHRGGSTRRLETEAFLLAAGVVPNTDDLGLEQTGIQVSAGGYIEVDKTLQTSVPGIYAFGDCIGNHFFRHTVNYEGEYLLRTQIPEPTPEPIEYGPVPHAVFTHPQVAGVGATEDELAGQGVDYVAGIGRYAKTTMGMARGGGPGFAKILIDRPSRRLLGAHILGDEASDMIHALIVMMKMGGTLDDLLDVIYIHPALPEAVRDAARDARRALHENG